MERKIGNKYRIVKAAGSGGGGMVFQVYDCRLERQWAAKLIKRDQESLEERILGTVDASAFVRIVDVVEEEEGRYLIMDWIEGETLESCLSREGPMESVKVIEIGIALAKALETLHKMQPPVLYLDCKPSNVMVGKGGQVFLVDFGSAMLCEGHSVVPLAGSFGYGAPEQLRGEASLRRADVRSDVYALGRTLYAALSGRSPIRPPFPGPGLADCNSAIPIELVRIIEKCTQSDPGRRYQTMTAVLQALQDCQRAGGRRRLERWLSMGVGFLLLFLASWHFAGWVEIAVLKRTISGYQLWAGLCWIYAFWVWQRFWVERRRRKRTCCEVRYSVLRTQKKFGRWPLYSGLFFFLLLIPALCAPTLRGTAAEAEPINGKGRDTCDFVLRDEQLRKLLIKEGTTLETKDSVYLEIDPTFFLQGEIYTIQIRGTDSRGNSGEYQLLYRVAD